jgi:hypothetical protein
MCMEDEQLGKSKKIGQSAIVVGGVSTTAALPGNAKRVGLIVSVFDAGGFGNGSALIGTSSSTTAGLIGWFDLHNSPVILTLKDWGTIIQQEIWALSSVAGVNLYLTEILTEVEIQPYRGKI